MSEPLTYRVAVVTGATSGIGRATVTKLCALGLTVYAVGRNEGVLDELARDCGAKPVQADVRDTAAVARQLDGVEVDILINNAGILSTRATFSESVPRIAPAATARPMNVMSLTSLARSTYPTSRATRSMSSRRPPTSRAPPQRPCP